MENNELLPVEICCAQYNIQHTFIESLEEHGLIEIVHIEQQHFLHADELQHLEPLIRMHYDLDINMEGIEAISNILSKMKNLQSELVYVKNRLRFYENE